MGKDFPFVRIKKELLKRLGRPDPGTRLYRAYGTEADSEAWFDAVWEVCDDEKAISPGGVAMYVKVSRPAVHKRLKEGRLTGFYFHQTKEGRFFKGRKKLDEGGRPYIFIPVSECKAWAEELKERKELTEEEMSIPETTRKYDSVEKPPRGWRKSIKEE